MAPVLPEYVGVPHSTFLLNDAFGYYTDAGWKAQSFSVHTDEKGALAVSGSFRSGAPGKWVWGPLSTAEIKAKIQAHKASYRVAQFSTVMVGGEPKHTALWVNRQNGELSDTFVGLSDEEAKSLLLANLNIQWVSDYSVYYAAGVRRQSISLSSKVSTYSVERTLAELVNDNNGHEKAGLEPYAFHATAGVPNAQIRFSAVWRPSNLDHRLYFDMTRDQLQARIDQFKKEGYEVYRIEGYGGTRYGAIWVKSPNIAAPAAVRRQSSVPLAANAR